MQRVVCVQHASKGFSVHVCAWVARSSSCRGRASVLFVPAPRIHELPLAVSSVHGTSSQQQARWAGQPERG